MFEDWLDDISSLRFPFERERERERVTLSKRNRSSELDINPSGKGDWLKISN